MVFIICEVNLPRRYSMAFSFSKKSRAICIKLRLIRQLPQFHCIFPFAPHHTRYSHRISHTYYIQTLPPTNTGSNPTRRKAPHAAARFERAFFYCSITSRQVLGKENIQSHVYENFNPYHGESHARTCLSILDAL